MKYNDYFNTYAVEPRDDYQDAFIEFLFANGFDSYGYRDKNDIYENDVFIVRPYYWGDEEGRNNLPNFVYKPTGLEINWYKYPMRGAYSNMDVSIENFKKLLAHCATSMRGE